VLMYSSLHIFSISVSKKACFRSVFGIWW
jgi:hypothetical protein